MKKKKIGIYGGTFDPIHFGHINLAIELMERSSLAEVWFCPANINPHKLNQNPTPAHHRVAMLELALHDIPFFKINDLECQREGPSYMVDTLRQLISQNPSSYEFSLILGKDAIHGFFDWHQPEEIVKLVSLLIGYRTSDKDESLREGDPAIKEAIRKGLVPSHILDISSTEIRHRIKEGRYCQHLLPESVLHYIRKHKLYH